MGIREKHTPRRESVNVWRSCLRVTAETADPIVQIINRNEQDIGFVCLDCCRGCRHQQKQQTRVASVW